MSALTQRVTVVTGSVSGIGRGIATRFGSLGAQVVVHGPHDDGAQEVAAELRRAGYDADAVGGDLRDVEACRAVMRFAVERYGGVDVLVNNAASVARGSLESAPIELWDAIMAANLRAPFVCLQEAVKSMKTRGGGSIVNIGSINAYVGLPNLGPYSVSKGGLMTMTKNAALALNTYRIRVNQINVGWTLTENEDRTQRADGKGDNWLEAAVKTRAWGRLLSPADIASAAEYFATDASALVTGAVLDLEQFPLGGLPT